jgi:hypothetical protein
MKTVNQGEYTFRVDKVIAFLTANVSNKHLSEYRDALDIIYTSVSDRYPEKKPVIDDCECKKITIDLTKLDLIKEYALRKATGAFGGKHISLKDLDHIIKILTGKDPEITQADTFV